MNARARHRLRRRFAIAVWTVLIAIAASSARGQVIQRYDDEPSATSRPSGAPAAPASPAAAPTVYRPRVGLIIAGFALFTATWVPTLILSSRGGGGCDDQGCRDAFEVVWFPVLGPLLAYDKNGNLPEGLAVLWTLAEAAGLAMGIAGLIGRQVPVDSPPKSSLRITPTLSPGGAGLFFGATF